MAIAKCRECGDQVSTEAVACPHCGAPQRQTAPPMPPVIGGQNLSQQTGRTESVVVQVAPSFENDKITEMGMFGWNLQSRQEIHQEGDAYGRPSYLDSNTYVVKTTVHHYVKLHFVRNVTLPNLERIRQLETEYFGLAFPPPASLLWPIILTVIPIPGGLAMLADPLGKQGSPGLFGLVIVAGWVFLAVRWINKRRTQNADAAQTRETSSKRANEIITAAQSLL